MAMKTKRLGGRMRTSAPLKQADLQGARELRLFIDNDADLYRQRTTPIHKNLVNKLGGGTFDFEKSVKMFTFLTDDGAQRYNKEFGDGTLSMKLFDRPTRLAAARVLAEEFLIEANLGNFDNSLNQKNKGAIWAGKLIRAGTKVIFKSDRDVDRLGAKKGKGISAELVRSPDATKSGVDTGQPLTIGTEVLLRFPNGEFAKVPINLVKEA